MQSFVSSISEARTSVFFYMVDRDEERKADLALATPGCFNNRRV
jgi:hypothetical protein